MPQAGFVLFADDSTWRIAATGHTDAASATIVDVPVPEGETPAQLAALIVNAASGVGWREGSPALLAVPASWCLAAPIDLHDLPPNDRKAMLFRFEEKLPLAAEAIIADFVVDRERGTALGVCARMERIAPVVETLEAAGFVVQSVTPAVLLAATAAIEPPAGESSAPPAGAIFLCGESPASVSLITIDDAGAPSSWAVAHATLADLKLQFDVSACFADPPPPVIAMDVDAGLLADFTEVTGQPVEVRDEPMITAAVRQALAVLAGTSRPVIEFRRGPLAIHDRLRRHRKSLDALLAAAVALLLALTLVFFVRAARYSHRDESLRREMAREFTRQFPGWQVPANIKAVVESEHRKRTSSGSGAAPVEARQSALSAMQAVLSHLPGEGRIAIDHMTFEPASFQLGGRLRSYEQVDALVTAARQGGFDVPPPQTLRNDDGSWTYTLRGTRANRASAMPPQVARGAAAE
jgi:hypothetical protein